MRNALRCCAIFLQQDERSPEMRRIEVSLAAQSLKLLDDAGALLHRYSVSTSRNGAGELKDSFCTPRGRHIIRAKIGAGLAENTIFIGRRPSGETYTPALGERYPGRDWILTRILWLSGCEPGFNRLCNVDTMRRYIYIHGSPDSAKMGKPSSIGCIRMRNRDIIELFDQVAAGTPVDIAET
jgi:L,D-transpeptidase YbiS